MKSHQTGTSRPPVTMAVRLIGPLLLVCCLIQLSGWGLRPAAAQDSRIAPLPGQVLRTFEIGEADWQPGHRGIDLAGTPGAQVRAPASGTVSWVGSINGTPMMTIQHPDGLRTTYQPVQALLPQGTDVTAGEVVATLQAGHCTDTACLHFGLRAGERYLDPLAWLGGRAAGQVRLLPRSATPRQLPPVGAADHLESAVLPTGELPVPGPITSAWGPRTSPISGPPEFHDGIDIGAACGLPVQVSAPGVVVSTGTAGGYGLRVEVDHGSGQGTSYSHLSGIAVTPGQTVAAGQVIGQVGTTGWSTGCHLHYSVTSQGQSIDPLGG